MKKVTQVLIMAGGHGSRMSKGLNPRGCKSLIEYKGQSMIGHLLDHLLEAGIERIIIATNVHSHDAIKEIVTEKQILSAIVIIADGKPVAGIPEYNGVPYELRDLLDERFLMVCGHHPVSVSHITNLIHQSVTYKNVLSAYSNVLFTMDKMKRLILINSQLQYVNLENDIVANNHLYARNPYIVERKILDSVHDDNYRETFSYYIFKQSEVEKNTLGVAIADMPPEFDYDSEYIKVKDFLGTE